MVLIYYELKAFLDHAAGQKPEHYRPELLPGAEKVCPVLSAKDSYCYYKIGIAAIFSSYSRL